MSEQRERLRQASNGYSERSNVTVPAISGSHRRLTVHR